MSKLSFVKYQGAGNDFILIDDRALFFDPSQVSFLCDRKFGVGADGVILLQNDFKMRIYNCDGSEAESCGNGLRCLMKFLLHLGFPKKPYRIQTGNRLVEADFVGDLVRVQMGRPMNVQKFQIEGIEAHSLDTGVPHAVIFVPDVQKVKLETLGAQIRYHEAFKPRGTNVNFASIMNDGSIQVRTYERGIEGESFACGTGAAAVAAIVAQKYGVSNPILIRFFGGDLQLEVTADGISMMGPAVEVFQGTINL